MIEVSQFTKCYDDFTAVNSISFDVPAGRVAALVGPNGAGKTTTIRTLCGILSPTAGDLHVAGASLNDDPLAVKRRTAYVPDDPPLFDSMTVDDHLRFIASAYRLTDWEPLAEDLCGQFELTEKRETIASGLSRGMRQKVAIVCAYLRQPSVLLLDEPMTGLDPPSIRRFKQTVREQADRGATVLVSSHLLSLVDDICDHLVLMRRGEVLFHGPLEQARQEFGGDSHSLEEVFFRLTSEDSDFEDSISEDSMSEEESA